jgi:glycolate oxidase iron-sulfur subunit
LQAARYLLEALGHEVVETSSECCGALARHAGDVAGATRAADETRTTLEASGAEVVLTCASGCHGDLRDQVRPQGLRVVDALAFLVEDARWPTLRFRALEKRAALHLPCTQVNVVGDVGKIRDALARIPALSITDLPQQPRCCGAAGTYFIENPGIADALRDEKLAQTAALEPDLLLTTNIGCRIHLGNGLRESGSPLEVMHPLALLARQLDNASP